MPRKHYIVKGLVQGVGFRVITKRAADRLALAGFVRNLPNGDVEIEAEGPEEALEKFLGQVKIGSRVSTVEDVIVTPIADRNESSFSILS